MKQLKHELGTIYVPGADDDLRPLFDLARSHEHGGWAADTETVGLGIYKPGYRVRMVQVGTRDEAWLLNPEYVEHREAIDYCTGVPGTWWHNFVFDSLSLEQDDRLHISADITMGAARDTEILSRLLDPRGPEHGGVGHSLKGLSAHYLKLSTVAEARGDLLKAAKKKRYRDGKGKLVTASTMWEFIPYDDDDYQYYAGQDVFLANRLAEVLAPLVEKRGLNRFRDFEQGLAIKCAQMQRTGVNFDEPYAKIERDNYDAVAMEADENLLAWGVVPGPKGVACSAINSQIEVLQRLGYEFQTFTEKTHKPQLTKEVLAELSERDDQIGAFAKEVRTAKHAAHYRDYLDSMLVLAGKDGRIHPDIRPMRAATARMSISQPAFQQLPADDDTVRGAVVADEGDVLVSADYAQIEFRVAAAVSGDPEMIRRIMNGEDLHAATAEAIYGPDFTKSERSLCKRVGFGRLYRGTPKSIAAQTGIALPLVKRATKGFDKAYKATARWGDRVQASVKAGNTTIITATGRPLICTKPWAAVNYSIQSPARDIFAMGIINLWRNGLGERLRLVVHDEVILSVPEKEAERYCREIEASMNTTFKGLPIVTEAEVLGKRWHK